MESLAETLRQNADRVAYNTIADFRADVEGFAKAEFEEIHHGRAYFDWDKAHEKLMSAAEDLIGQNANSQITHNHLLTLHEDLSRSFYREADAIHFSNASQVALRIAIKAHGEREKLEHQNDNGVAANDAAAPSAAA